MNETLIAFGRGCVKVFISLFVGTGIGLLTFGIAAAKDAERLWEMHGPPVQVFQAAGAGVLSAGAMMALLFYVPRRRGTAAPQHGKAPGYEELPR